MPLKNAREFVRERKEGRGRIEYRCYWKKVALVSRVLVSGSRSPPINRSRVYGNQFRWTVLLRERERERRIVVEFDLELVAVEIEGKGSSDIDRAR